MTLAMRHPPLAPDVLDFRRRAAEDSVVHEKWLERMRELTGLDPFTSEDRERLGLGLKAYRIIAPRLPR